MVGNPEALAKVLVNAQIVHIMFYNLTFPICGANQEREGHSVNESFRNPMNGWQVHTNQKTATTVARSHPVLTKPIGHNERLCEIYWLRRYKSAWPPGRA